MNELVILVPALNRPTNVAPLLVSLVQSTPMPYCVLFICDPGDIPQQDAIAKYGGRMISPGGGYAAKIHAGVQATTEPLIFLGADDLRFQPGWLRAATRHFTAAIQVVGVNDLIPRRRRLHSTHFLMTRDYAQRPCIDDTPGPLSQAYSHNFCDDELIRTATHRGAYEYAPTSIVEHLHPLVRTAADDATYELGREHFAEDQAIFRERSALWT